MKTREELEAEGILLLGPLVPLWFRLQSDGGSVPGGWFGRWLLKEKQWRAAAFIHDFCYYIIALMYKPGSSAWVTARFRADDELKRNRRKCAKNRFIGWMTGRLIFRGVRVGGAVAMRTVDEIAVPPIIKSVEEVEALCEEWTRRAGLTEQAREQIVIWKRSIA